MQGSPTGYWAKLEGKPGALRAWHPLEHHSADVAACCEVLLQTSLLRSRLARLGNLEDLDTVQVARLCFLAALHDVGKFNVGFQNKALVRPPFTRGHVTEVLSLLAGGGRGVSGRLYEVLQPERFAVWGETAEACGRLFVAAICHHGKPYRLHFDPDSTPWRSWRGMDPFDGIRDLAGKAIEWFPEAEGHDGLALPANAEFQHGFAGLVQLADWMGSNTKFFPFGETEDPDRMDFARMRAREVVAATGLDAGPARSTLPSLPSFQLISDHRPYETQSQLVDAPVGELGGIDILEAETGSGKTEAAIGRFLELFRRGRVDGMYFALPTRTAATQMHRRVVEAVARAFPDPACRPPVVLAVPDYLQVDDTSGQLLAPFEVLWSDDSADRYRYRGWAAENPKRFLAASIAVGTIDQVLLSTLVVSHAHLRSSSLMRQLLVVDEVHASDMYMARLLEAVLETHLRSGGYALLMSATLGASARSRLLNAAGVASRLPELEPAKALGYPLITSWPAPAREPQELAVRAPGNPKSMDLSVAGIADRPEAVAEAALDAAADGAHVLVIRNLVDDCVRTQEAIEALAEQRGLRHLLWTCQGQACPHHSRFAREDRRLLDAAIETEFGKGRGSHGCVAVATQTVQQSLDLDADFMISDLCPIDVLLQRAGRLHRHQIADRPRAYRRARLVVLTPEDRDLGVSIRPDDSARGHHGIGTVYEDLRILEASLRCIERHPQWTIPEMSRSLVEDATHPAALAALVAELGGHWERHGRWVEGQLAAQAVAGAGNLVDRQAQYGEFAFPSGMLERRVATRLGASDRAVTLPEIEGPFGTAVQRIAIAAHLARDIPADAEPEIGQRAPGRFDFRMGPRRYRYDRLGLHKLE